MATGMDGLVDFMLAEIALCGTEGTYLFGSQGHEFESLHRPSHLL
jgi:hypothetical protein